MDTCVICHIAYDPCCDEEGRLLIDRQTGICKKCQKRIDNRELKVEDYDIIALDLANINKTEIEVNSWN